MRYAEGGGLSAVQRAVRERVRLQAAEMFAAGVGNGEVARRLWVTPMSVWRWKSAWQAGGVQALRSKGASGAKCRLTPSQLARLASALEAGPAAHGFCEDQRWTLVRVAWLIKKLFRVNYTLVGVGKLLHRLGFSVQVLTRRAVERDEEAIAQWQEVCWPVIKERRRHPARGSVSRTKQAKA